MSLSPELLRKIRRVQITSTRAVDDLFAGAYHSVFKGQGMEFEDVREYIPGDDVRSIDRNVTARFNHPFVKSFREERELTVMLVVDVSASSHYGSSDRAKSELIAEIGAVIAFSAIKNNDNIGLLLSSDRVEAYIPPKKGVRHVLRVIRELLAFEAKGKGTNISGALEFLGQVHRRKGVCFVVSDFMDDGIEKAILLAAKKQDLIGVNVSDKHELQFPNLSYVTLQDLESGEVVAIDTANKALRAGFERTSSAKREGTRKLFAKAGADYLEVGTDGDYLAALEKFFRMRQRRRR